MDADDFKQRAPCFFCERKFALEALERHEKICEKTSQKKRKQFDSSKQRHADGDNNVIKAEAATIPPKKSQKAQTKTGRPTQRASRPSTVPARLIAPSNDCVPCPHCDRNFGSKSADRHIKWCGEQKSRIPRSPPNYTAKNRLSARILYKAPLPGKKSSLPNIRQSPKNPHGVSVTGKAITPAPSVLGDTVSHTISPCESISGTSSSSGWEWEQKALPTATQSTNRAAKKDNSYDPYTAAKKQMQQLRSTVHPNCGTAPTDCDPFYSDGGDRVAGDKAKALQRRRANRALKHQLSEHDDNNNNSRLSNISQDSDYCSLFPRRSPNSKSRSPSPTRLLSLSLSQSPQMEFLVGSTSGSESSLPSVISPNPISPTVSKGQILRLPKFCHECGSQYPVQTAKYCCECGVRRLFV